MRRQLAHARGYFFAGLLTLAFAAPAAGAEPVTAAAARLERLRPVGDDLVAKRLRNILYADRWNRARSLFDLGDYHAAASYYMALVEEPVDERSRYEIRYRLAECFFYVGAYPGAARYFRLVIESDPNGQYTAAASARLAQLAVKMGEISEARKRFAAAAVPGETRSRAAYALGHALAPMSATEAATYLALVEKGTRYYPEARFHLGALAATSPASYAQAVTRFLEARAALPEQPDFSPGKDLEEQARIPRLRELTALSLARVYADSGEPLKALDEYANVPETGRYRDVALLESAWVLLRIDRVLPALENVQALLREQPESPRVLEAALLVGYLTIEQGKFNSAYGHFEDTRRLLEGLEKQLAAYADSQTKPTAFYYALVEAEGPPILPAQIALWVKDGRDVKRSNTLLEEVREVEKEIRDLYRQIDEIEVRAAGPRGGAGDPAWNDNLVRLEISNALYRLQGRILALRLRPFLKAVSNRESTLLRTVRRVRADLIAIRYTPSDVNSADARRQAVLAQLSQYLLQIHPEIGLDTAKRDADRRVAEVERPLWADDYLRQSRRELAELSRENTLDDRWIDAAIEYTVYLEDRLHGAILRRLRVDERYDFVKKVSVLFRQSVELQRTLKDLGVTLAEIQEQILLDIHGRTIAERSLLANYRGVAKEIHSFGRELRGLAARQQYASIASDVADTALRADLGAIDTGWRVKELEDSKVRELLAEKQTRLHKLNDYYADVMTTSPGAGPYDGVEDFSPEKLAQAAGSVDSPYGRELLELGREVTELAKALQLARMQQEKLAAGAEGALLTPEEAAAEHARDAAPAGDEGLKLRVPDDESKPRRMLPVKPGERP